MDQNLLTSLRTQVSEIGAVVGFTAGEPGPDLPDASLPANTWIWSSPFAVLAVVPLASNDISIFTNQVSAGKEWMWRFLKKSEDAGVFIDGYLAVALPEEPEGSLRSAVREVEADTSVCRKHVVWPKEGSWSERLRAITTVGLPEVSPTTEVVAQPDLPVLAQRALSLYAERKSYEAVADILKAEVETAAIQEISDAD
jgi:hypothetical protein